MRITSHVLKAAGWYRTYVGGKTYWYHPNSNVVRFLLAVAILKERGLDGRGYMK